MHKKQKRRISTKGGGMFDTGMFDSVGDKAKNWWGQITGSPAPASTTYTPPPPVYTPPPSGGKSKKRRYKGGYHNNIPTTGLASHSGQFSGNTARPHNYVGGKSKKRCYKGGKKTRRRR